MSRINSVNSTDGRSCDMGSAGDGLGTEEKTQRMHHFKWTEHESKVLQQLKTVFALMGGSGEEIGLPPDVMLIGNDGESVQAHKIVLSLCSPYFQKMFAKTSAVCKRRPGPMVVVLENVKTSQLRRVIQFIYTGEVEISVGDIEEFLASVTLLQIEGMSGFTVSSLSKGSSETNPEMSMPVEVSMAMAAGMSSEGIPVKLESVGDEVDAIPTAQEDDGMYNDEGLSTGKRTKEQFTSNAAVEGEVNKRKRGSDTTKQDPVSEEPLPKKRRSDGMPSEQENK